MGSCLKQLVSYLVISGNLRLFFPRYHKIEKGARYINDIISFDLDKCYLVILEESQEEENLGFLAELQTSQIYKRNFLQVIHEY